MRGQKITIRTAFLSLFKPRIAAHADDSGEITDNDKEVDGIDILEHA
jgi:hypothetical protein